MRELQTRLLCFVWFCAMFGVVGCGGIGPVKHDAREKVHYLKYNFHYTTEKGKASGSVANYTDVPDHKILPHGSPVRAQSWKNGFALLDERNGTTINVLAKGKFLAGTSLSEYIDLILSKTPADYANLSEIDQKGISEGRPYRGMSKKGVMIALGYPCPHRTPSPDVDAWRYWRNRFENYVVTFENGIVVSSGF